MRNKLKNFVKNNDLLTNLYYRYQNLLKFIKHFFVSDKKQIEKKWKSRFKTKICWENPQTLNEKIQWLKVYDRKPIYTILADKYESRKYIEKHFGSEYLIPLYFKTDKIKQINAKNIDKFPCIIKPNNNSGAFQIIRDGNINWKNLRRKCKTWINNNYYYSSQEWPYKNMKPYIIVEKLLTDENGKIPNDYKLHFINGEFVFVYCSIDREKKNYRQVYDINWKLLPFLWSGNSNDETIEGPKIEKPKTFDTMIKIGKEISKLVKYVRVDFFEVDNKLFCGEITFYHGSGFNSFVPSEFDLYYGKKLRLLE